MAITPSVSPIEVMVDGEALKTRTSHTTGMPDITTAAAGAAERNEPREYAANNNRMPTPLAAPARAPYIRSLLVGLPDQNRAVTAVTTTPANRTAEVTSLAFSLLVTSDAKKSLSPIANVESTA